MQIRITCRGRACDAADYGLRELWRRGRRTCQAVFDASHTSKAEWERHALSHLPFPDWRRLAGVSNVVMRSIQDTDDQFHLYAFDCGHLSGDATPMLVANDGRTGMPVHSLLREREQRTRMQWRSRQGGWTRWARHRRPHAAMEKPQRCRQPQQ